MALRGIQKLLQPREQQLNMIRALVIRSADYGIVIFDGQGILMEYNTAASVLFGLRPDMNGQYTAGAFLADKLARSGSPDQFVNETEINVGQRRFQINDKRVYDDDGTLITRFLTFTDITKVHDAVAELENSSQRDFLTGLLSRYAYYKELHVRDQQDDPVTVVRCSVENLALINEVFGNEYGDGVIQAVGQTLQSLCEENDVCARIDGVDFAFILGRSEEEARALFESEGMHCIHVRDGANEIAVNLIFGVAGKTNDGSPIENLLKTALEDVKTNRLRNEDSIREAIMKNLRNILLSRKLYDDAHEAKTQKYLTELGRTCNLNDQEIDELLLFAIMRDIGMVSVPPDILKRRGSLTDSEWDIVKLHVVRGSFIANSIPELAPIANELLHHHERWDGLGYPDQLAGTDIPIKCRILDIVRYYMRHLYGKGKSPAAPFDTVLAEMDGMSGQRFDPKLLVEFEKIVEMDNHPLDFAVSELR